MNTVLIAVTNLILRALGMWFNVYISGQIGAQGIGVFSLIMNVYMLGVSAAFAGAGFAATRLVAEELALGSTGGAYSAVKKCLAYCFLCSVGVCFAVYFSADCIASEMLKNAGCAKSLRILAPAFPFISAASVLKGYFNASDKVAVACGGDFFGNAARIVITVVAFRFFTPQTVTEACEYLAFAMLVSEILSFLFFLLLYVSDKRNKICVGCGAQLWRRLFKIAVPVATSGFIKSGLSSFNQMLIPKGLLKSGMDDAEAMSIYGLIRGMVFPVLMFPSALLSAVSTVLVPETAKLYVSGKNNRICETVSRIFYFTSHFAVLVAVVLMFFSAELGEALYDSSEAGVYMAYLAPLVLIMYFDETVDSVLKGIDKQVNVVLINIADKALCIILVFFLISEYGVAGYIAMLYISEFFNGFMSIGALIKALKIKLNIFKLFILPFMVAVFSYASVSLLPYCDFKLKISAMTLLYIFLVFVISRTGKYFFESKNKQKNFKYFSKKP